MKTSHTCFRKVKLLKQKMLPSKVDRKSLTHVFVVFGKIPTKQ